MIDRDELLFVVDENDNPLIPLPRSQVIKEGSWRRTTGAILVDTHQRNVLCQKRSDTKDERPGFWIADFGGKTSAGESAEECILRELKEELGVDLKLEKLHFYKKMKSIQRRQIEYLFWVDWNGNLETIKFEPEEISEIAVYSIDEIKEFLKNPAKGWYSYGFEIALLDWIETHR